MRRVSLTFLWALAVLQILFFRPQNTMAQHLEENTSFWSNRAALGEYSSPQWHNGFVARFSFDFPPQIKVLDRTGSLVTDATIAFPSAPWVRVTNVAVSSSGRVAFTLLGRDDQGRSATAVGWISRSGEIEQIVRTEEYALTDLGFAPDGTLWAVGRNNIIDVLVHYDEAGNAMSRMDISRDDGLNFDFSQPPRILFPIEDRVGLLLSGKGVWTELSLEGDILGQWEMPSGVGLGGIALTPLGEFYFSTYTPVSQRVSEDDPDTRLLRLDREHDHWVEISYDGLLKPGDPRVLELHGSQGEDLVVNTIDTTRMVVAPIVSR